MISEYRVIVNGEEYEVSIECLSGGSNLPEAPKVSRRRNPDEQQTVAAPAQKKPEPVKPAPAVKEEKAPAPAAQAAPSSGNETVIEAPLPGNIWKVKVTAGQSVKKGDVLVILEAMKMENEIFAPVDGVVQSVAAVEGKAVGTGDVLCVIA